MVMRMLIGLIALVHFVAPVDAGLWESIVGGSKKQPPPTIKTLLVHDKIGVILEVKGKYKIVDPHTGKFIASRFDGKRKFVQALQGGLRWGEDFPGIHQIVIVPEEHVTTIVDGIEYPGKIYVYDVNGSISIINQVPIEELVSLSLSQYQKQQVTPELGAALVIAARTTAYYYTENPKSDFWAIDAQKLGYQGTAARAMGTLGQAVQSTKYMVMSTSAPREDEIKAFPATWKGEANIEESVVSQISVPQARDLAAKGEDAAQILLKAYPGIHIELMQYIE